MERKQNDELFKRCMALSPDEKVIIFMRLFGWMEKSEDNEFFETLGYLLDSFKRGEK